RLYFESHGPHVTVFRISSVHCTDHPYTLHLFPTRRSSDLIDDDGGGQMRRGSGERSDPPPPADDINIRCPRSVNLIQADSSIQRSEEHTSELQSRFDLVCRLLLEKKKQSTHTH